MIQKGVYALSWISHLLLAPPLIVTEEELDQGIAVLDECLATADAAL